MRQIYFIFIFLINGKWWRCGNKTWNDVTWCDLLWPVMTCNDLMWFDGASVNLCYSFIFISFSLLKNTLLWKIEEKRKWNKMKVGLNLYYSILRIFEILKNENLEKKKMKLWKIKNMWICRSLQIEYPRNIFCIHVLMFFFEAFCIQFWLRKEG